MTIRGSNDKTNGGWLGMAETFFGHPILNSPYAYPGRHWVLDADGQPTNVITGFRRRSDLIAPMPKPKKQRRRKGQIEMVLDFGDGLSIEEQEHNRTPIINKARGHVDGWRPRNPALLPRDGGTYRRYPGRRRSFSTISGRTGAEALTSA